MDEKKRLKIELLDALNRGLVSRRVNLDEQAKHDFPNVSKSYLVGVKAEDLIRDFGLTGEIRKFGNNYIEYINDAGRAIGKYVDGESNLDYFSYSFEIIYTKNGIHVFPTRRGIM